MHDPFSTMQGQYGFIVRYPDGSVLTEFDCTWDEVPADQPITSLEIYDTFSDRTLCALAGYEKYYFSNEAVCAGTFEEDVGVTAGSDMSIKKVSAAFLSGKLIGGIRGDRAVQDRVDTLSQPDPEVVSRDLKASEVKFAAHVMRPGIV